MTSTEPSRTRVGGALAAAAVTLATAILICLTLAPAFTALVDAAPIADESRCVQDVDKWSHPSHVLLGETVDVTMTVRIVCPADPVDHRVVLVLDASDSMQGAKNQDMRAWASRYVRSGLNLGHGTRAGVAEFNSTGRTLAALTNDEDRLLRVVRRVEANGDTSIDLGIREGRRILRSGQSTDEISRAIILMSDGLNDAGDRPALAAARAAKNLGILVMTVCVGNDCNDRLMREMASSPRYHYRLSHGIPLRSLPNQQLDDRPLNVLVKKLVVKDTLSPQVQYVPGSAVPMQSSPDEPSRWLQWEDVYVPKEGVTYTYKVRPLGPGNYPVSEEGWAELTDSKNRTKDWVFPIPWVTVLQPHVLPTPDWTATPTTTPSPTRTPMPSLTPRADTTRVHLPVVSSGGE